MHIELSAEEISDILSAIVLAEDDLYEMNKNEDDEETVANRDAFSGRLDLVTDRLLETKGR